MIRFTAHLILLFCLLLSFNASATNGGVASFMVTRPEGLSSQICYTLVKGSDGLIWVSTRNGVDCYDGKVFTHYRLSNGAVREKKDGMAIKLHKDVDGELYAYNERNHIFWYNRKKIAFECVVTEYDMPGIGALQTIYKYGHKIYLGSNQGLYCYDLEQKKILWENTGLGSVLCFVSSADGQLLAGSSLGVFCLRFDDDKIVWHNKKELAVTSICIAPGKKGLWLGSVGRGLWHCSAVGENLVQVPYIENAIILSVENLDDGKILIGTNGGGLYIKDCSDVMSPVSLFACDSPEAPYKLVSSAVQSVLVDKGNIWVSMYMGGLVVMSPVSNYQKLDNWKRQVDSENFLFGLSCDSKGDIWAAFNRSILRYKKGQDNPDYFLDFKGQFLCVQPMRDGSVWCAGFNTGMYHLWPETGKYTFLRSVDGAQRNDNVYALLEDRHGNLWAGGLNMKVACIRNDKPVRLYDINFVYDIVEVNDSIIVFATCDGFYTVNARTHEVCPYINMYSPVPYSWTATNYLCAVDCRNGHDLWFATDGAGLLTYDLNTRTLASFGLEDGLPSLQLRSLQFINDSVICVGTEEGCMFSFDVKSRKFIASVSKSDGLDINELYQNSSCVTADGDFVVGTDKGGIVLGPSMFHNNKSDFTIFVTSQQMDNNELYVPYDNRLLDLYLTTSDIYHQQHYHYFYMIEGYDSDWKPVEDTRHLRFYSLPAGSYTLRVRAVAGPSNQSEVSFPLHVAQKPWLSIPAIILYLVLLALAIFVAFRLYKSFLQQQQSDEKIQFFSNVAHDIRTPLSLVAAPLYDLEKIAGDNEQVRSVLGVMKRNVSHLTNIVSQLTEFNRFQNDKVEMAIRPVLLQSFVDGVVSAYKPLLEQKGLSFSFNAPTEDVWVAADVLQLNRVIDNLMGNAVKYTKQGGVSLFLSVQSGNAVLEVRDTGMGMSAETQKMLFRRFFRGENAINSLVPGCGIGLLFTFQLVKKMNGNLWCTSQEGVGSSFFLEMPLSEAGGAETVSEQLVSTSAIATSLQIDGLDESRTDFRNVRQSVLLVEDNPELREYLAVSLHPLYNVFKSADVQEAKAVMKDEDIDLIISDIMMPGMRGDDWCAELKKHIETSHIPVILLTALADVSTQINGLSVGADDYVTKPFDMNVLLLKVGNLFQSRRRLRSYYMHSLHLAPLSVLEDNEPVADKVEANSLDDQFLADLMRAVDEVIDQADVNIDDIAQKMALSHTLFYEKVRKLLDMTPAELLRSCRMKRAMDLLQKGGLSVADVAVRCGFSDARYFSSVFKKFHGVSPSKVLQS